MYQIRVESNPNNHVIQTDFSGLSSDRAFIASSHQMRNLPRDSQGKSEVTAVWYYSEEVIGKWLDKYEATVLVRTAIGDFIGKIDK